MRGWFVVRRERERERVQREERRDEKEKTLGLF